MKIKFETDTYFNKKIITECLINYLKNQIEYNSTVLNVL